VSGYSSLLVLSPLNGEVLKLILSIYTHQKREKSGYRKRLIKPIQIGAIKKLFRQIRRAFIILSTIICKAFILTYLSRDNPA
jgi:hypothetical protein